VEAKTFQNGTISLDFGMVRNCKPYPKLAKAHTTIKDNALKDAALQLVMADIDS